MHLAAKSEPAPSNAVVCDVDGNLALYFLLLSPLCLIQLSGTANDRARVLHRGTAAGAATSVSSNCPRHGSLQAVWMLVTSHATTGTT
jgi:hypothetical protein